MYNLYLIQGAEDDLDEILSYYESLRSLGSFEFSLQIEKTFERLEQNPFIFNKHILFFRRAFIEKYPYVVYYHIFEDVKEVEVVAIIHHKRGMEHIKQKLKNIRP